MDEVENCNTPVEGITWNDMKNERIVIDLTKCYQSQSEPLDSSIRAKILESCSELNPDESVDIDQDLEEEWGHLNENHLIESNSEEEEGKLKTIHWSSKEKRNISKKRMKNIYKNKKTFNTTNRKTAENLKKPSKENSNKPEKKKIPIRNDLDKKLPIIPMTGKTKESNDNSASEDDLENFKKSENSVEIDDESNKEVILDEEWRLDWDEKLKTLPETSNFNDNISSGITSKLSSLQLTENVNNPSTSSSLQEQFESTLDSLPSFEKQNKKKKKVKGILKL